MAIQPLQLPGPLIVPKLDFSPLDKIGDAYVENQQNQRDVEALRGFAKGLVTPEAPTTPTAMPGAPPSSTPSYPRIPGYEPSAAASPGPVGPTGPQLPRGLRNNNPGNIEDGALAKSLPGYAGSDGRFAKFDTPENGLNAMDALLVNYGRRGDKTVRDVVGRWAPASDNNNVNAYAKFVSPNGDPNAPIDLSDAAQRKQIAGRMAHYENGMPMPAGAALPAGAQGWVAQGIPGPGSAGSQALPAGQAPPSSAQMAQAAGGMPPELAKRVDALFASGSPLAKQLGISIISKYIAKPDYKFITGADGTIYRTNEAAGTVEPVAVTNKPALTETGTNPLSGQKSYSIFDPNKLTLTPLNASDKGDAGAPNPDQLAAKIATLRDAGATQEQLMNEIPAGWRNYVSSILKSGAIPTNLGRNAQARSILMDYAHIIDPNFDETQLLERKTFAQGMGDTKNPASYGGQLQSAGTVVKHLGDAYGQLGEFTKGMLGTTDTLNVLNEGKSWVRDQMGDQAFQDAKGHWDIVKKGIAGELERLLSGRGGAEASKGYWLDKLDFNRGPTKIAAALDEARSLMMGRVENVALAKGRAYGGQPDPISLFGPKEQKIMEKIQGGTFGAQQAAPQQSSPATPTRAPPVGFIQDGYRYKGGDPNDPKSWGPVAAGDRS